ncbi:MAG TPA: L-rhamnose isomerase [Spirochaetales bacterium]|nr:L-rhamnose isomerase [Spirochaetales bacterium]
MSEETRIDRNFELAKEVYASFGVDVEKVIAKFDTIPVSIPCWQGDDIGGFELSGGGASGGILVTGNYPGKPRNIEEFRQDLEKVLRYVPGPLKLNLHSTYGENYEPGIDRDEYAPRHFDGWIRWAKAHTMGLDFNCTTFGHPKAADNLTIANPNNEIRRFWVRHMIAARKIAKYMGEQMGQACVYNTWVQDGLKDMPADRMLYRRLMKDSFDEIFAEKISTDLVYDALEPKLFAIGVESYTVGSLEFYLGYHGYAKAAGIGNTIINLDMGHYHPTESIADKVSSVMLFSDKFMAHFTRGVRWDSDHVVINDDQTNEMMREIVRSGVLDKTFIGTDYFDATINRVAAWTIGTRATKRALLAAMLEPSDLLKKAELEGDRTARLALMDEFRSLPANAVWEKYCADKGTFVGSSWLADLKSYEKDVQFKR